MSITSEGAGLGECQTLAEPQNTQRLSNYSGFRLSVKTAGKMPALPAANALISFLFTQVQAAIM